MAATNQYRPDYAVPPGWVLEERLRGTRYLAGRVCPALWVLCQAD